MRGKRLSPEEPVDGILQHPINKGEGTTVLPFRCSRCRHMLPDLWRLDQSDDAGRLWIRADTESPLWRWDGNVLRPTRLHLDVRQRLQEVLLCSSDAGLKRITRKCLADHSPRLPDLLRRAQPALSRRLSASWTRWHPPTRSGTTGFFDPGPERIECPECRAEVQVPGPVATADAVR